MDLKESFQDNPCKINVYIRQALTACSKSNGIERAVCSHLLKGLHDDFVEEYLDNDVDNWCGNGYFMKNVTEEFKSNPCTVMKALTIQLESCDSTDPWCDFLTNMAENLKTDFYFDIGLLDLCQEKKFSAFVIENMMIMENPCELHKIMSEMDTHDMERRTYLGKLIVYLLEDLADDLGIEDAMGPFWDIKMCPEVDKVQDFVSSLIEDHGCEAISNFKNVSANCTDSTKFKNSHKMLCSILEKMDLDEIEEGLQDIPGFTGLANFKPCKEGGEIIKDAQNLYKEPCNILTTMDKFKKCSKSSIYCKIMNEILSDIIGEDSLDSNVKDMFGVGLTEINPCEVVDLLYDIYTAIGKGNTCKALLIVKSPAACKGKESVPCKMYNKLIDAIDGSDFLAEFKKAVGIEIWDIDFCVEWGYIKKLLIDFMDRPCNLFNLFKTYKDEGSVVSTLFREVIAPAIEDDEGIQSMLSEVDLCEEYDYITGIAENIMVNVGKGNCVGAAELMSYCPNGKCGLLSPIMECAKSTEGDICGQINEVMKMAAEISKSDELKDMCEGFPRVGLSLF